MMCNCRNVGPIDRVLRAIVGIVALALAFSTLGALDGRTGGIAAAVVGVVMLATAAMGMCPLYLPFKVSTCRTTPRRN